MRKVSNWIASLGGFELAGPSQFPSEYEDFLQWHYERQLTAGFSQDDIEDYPAGKLIEAMTERVRIGHHRG